MQVWTSTHNLLCQPQAVVFSPPMTPRARALERALQVAEETAAETGNTVAQVEVTALRRELQAELTRATGAVAYPSPRRWWGKRVPALKVTIGDPEA